MKIQIFHNKYQTRGGEDIMVEREVALLRSHSNEVKLELWDNHNIESVFNKISVAMDCAYSEKSEKIALEKIEKFKPDICHVHNFFPLLSPAIFSACKKLGVPVVFTAHNYRMFCANGLFLRNGRPCEICLHNSSYNAVLHSCYKKSRIGTVPVARMISHHRKVQTWNTKIDAIIALNEFAKSKMVEGKIEKEKIHIRFNYSEDLGQRSEKENYAIYFGRISEEKGISTLISAWKPEFPPLYVVGEGWVNPVWKMKANIKFIQGLTRETALIYLKKARFLILPTECYEGGTPLSVIEALSYGVPILISKIGGLSGLIQNQESGLYFEARDASSLSACVESFLKNPELENRLNINARKLYLEKFRPDVAYTRLIEIYKKVLN